LTIWWVERHTIGAVGGPKNDETRVVTPLMSADGVVNSGGTQYFRYVFTSDNGGSAFTSPWVPKGNYRVPDGALTPGKHYTYKVESQDSLPQSPTVTKTDSTWKFWTDTAPAAPTNVTVDGQALTTTGIETSVRPTLAATVSDPDGGQIQALFTVKQDGVVIMDSVPGSLVTVTTTGTGVSSVALPYAISKGATYTVEVVAFDGHMASSSVTPTGDFTGPTRTLREIPGNDDDETGAA
jgi:hypothetical protein